MAKNVTNLLSMHSKSPKVKIPRIRITRSTMKKGLHYLERFCKGLGRYILMCAVFFAIAKFVPEMREKLPNFYIIVDFSLKWFDVLCQFLVEFFKTTF